MFQKGRIIAKTIGSPTVTILDLAVPRIKFQPGQWVDFRIPSASWTGGFSITNVPSSQHNIQIAVKRSYTHAPAQWVTHESKVGDEVWVQVGGTCLLHNSDGNEACFLAGGIGISPMLGLYRQHAHERPATRVSFFYSVTTEDELVFRQDLENLMSQRSSDSCTMTLTQASEWKEPQSSSDNIVHALGRAAMTEYLQQSLLTNSAEKKIYYVCGPPSMQDEALSFLKQAKVPDDQLVYEKWW
mmetsp:Transcript_7130/g.10837  ORF Transcript_7130/g.10837 Transcript_7130/m.10837 type:complete len:242 (-) Transcript_7130:354-1079(-)